MLMNREERGLLSIVVGRCYGMMKSRRQRVASSGVIWTHRSKCKRILASLGYETLGSGQSSLCRNLTESMNYQVERNRDVTGEGRGQAYSPLKSRHRWAERYHSDQYTDSEMASQLPNSLVLSAKLKSGNRPLFMFLLWRDQGSNPGHLYPKRTLLPLSYRLSETW